MEDWLGSRGVTSLYAACRITGVELPGLAEWKRLIDEEEKRRESILQAPLFKDVFDQYPAKTEKVERNQPCPCGSGKKYKKCCGKG